MACILVPSGHSIRLGSLFSHMGLLAVIILIALIVVSLCLAVLVFFALQQEKAKGMKLQAELADVKTAQKIAESKLEESKKAISALELKLKEAQAQIDTLNSDLSQEKTARQEASAQAELLKKEADDQKQKRTDLEKKLTEEQKSSVDQANKLKALENRRITLEARIKELESKLEEYNTKDVELGTIVVAPEASTPQQAASPKKTAPLKPAAAAAATQPTVSSASGPQGGSSFEGKLLVVNKDYNFVVINMGSKDGVHAGDIFSVYHAGKYAGDVKVDKVHDSMAAAGFSSADMKDKVSEGDKVEAKAR